MEELFERDFSHRLQDVEKEIEREDGSFDTREIEVHYSIWYKLV